MSWQVLLKVKRQNVCIFFLFFFFHRKFIFNHVFVWNTSVASTKWHINLPLMRSCSCGSKGHLNRINLMSLKSATGIELLPFPQLQRRRAHSREKMILELYFPFAMYWLFCTQTDLTWRKTHSIQFDETRVPLARICQLSVFFFFLLGRQVCKQTLVVGKSVNWLFAAF